MSKKPDLFDKVGKGSGVINNLDELVKDVKKTDEGSKSESDEKRRFGFLVPIQLGESFELICVKLQKKKTDAFMEIMQDFVEKHKHLLDE